MEFGAQEGLHNNTLALLLEGWRGFWIEADAASFERLVSEFARSIVEGTLLASWSRVTAENIQQLLEHADVPGDIDLLSKRYRPQRLLRVEGHSGIPPALEEPKVLEQPHVMRW